MTLKETLAYKGARALDKVVGFLHRKKTCTQWYDPPHAPLRRLKARLVLAWRPAYYRERAEEAHHYLDLMDFIELSEVPKEARWDEMRSTLNFLIRRGHESCIKDG